MAGSDVYPSSVSVLAGTPTTGSIQRGRVTLAQIRRSCLYFCERQVRLPRPLSSQSRKRVWGIRDCTVVTRVLNRRTCDCTRDLQLRTCDTIAGSAAVHVLYNRIQNRRLQNHTRYNSATIALLRECIRDLYNNCRAANTIALGCYL